MTSMTDAAEVTETNPNRRSRRDGSAGSSRGERPLRSALRRLEEALEHAGPIRVSDRTRVALQTGLAMVLAYGVALAMDWHKPYWAGLAVAFCGLGSIGESLHKGMQRVLGTLVALVLAFVVLSLFIQDRWLFLLALSLWTAFCNYMSMTSARSYFWYVAGFSLPLLTVTGGGVPAQTFDVVVLRAQQTLLGVLSFTLVAVLLLPVGSGHGLAARAAELVSALRGLARDNSVFSLDSAACVAANDLAGLDIGATGYHMRQTSREKGAAPGTDTSLYRASALGPGINWRPTSLPGFQLAFRSYYEFGA